MAEAGNRLCQHDEGMMHVFSVHDLFKSKANITLVADRLDDLASRYQRKISRHVNIDGGVHPDVATPDASKRHGLENPLPVSSVSGQPVDAETFRQMDHDSRLAIAMKMVAKEIENGTAQGKDSVTRMLFPAASGLSLEEIERIAFTVEELWDLNVNVLQLNQGEIEPAQLEKLVERIKACKTDGEIAHTLDLLKALFGHELTDLAGAANPFLTVLPADVIDGYVSTADQLYTSVVALSERVRAGTDKDVQAEAVELYKSALPALDDASAALARERLSDVASPEFMVRRIAQATRKKPLTAEKAQKIINDLCIVRRDSPQVWPHLTQQLGREDNKLFHYYLPELFFILEKELEGDDNPTVSAYTTAAHVLAHSHKMIKKMGGEDSYMTKHGVQFIDLRKACLGIPSEIITAHANNEKFNPANLLFRGVKMVDVQESERSLVTNLFKTLKLDSALQAKLKEAVDALPTNVALLLNKEIARQLKEDEKSVILGGLEAFAKAVNDAGGRDYRFDWAPETFKILLFSMAQMYIQGRMHLRAGETGPYRIDLKEVIAAAEQAEDFQKLEEGRFKVSKHHASVQNQTTLTSAHLPRLESLSALPGKNTMIITCGGSSSISGASLGQLLEAAGKNVSGLVSVRSSTIRSLGGSDSADKKRSLPEGAEVLGDGIARITADSTSNGRFVENIAAHHYQTMLVLDEDRETLLDQIKIAMDNMDPKPDNVVFLSMGGSVTFPEERKKERKVDNPADFDLMHALTSLRNEDRTLPVSLLSMTSGLDAPHDMVDIMKEGGW